ncbi:MAG TPA: hypothetical protein DEH25_10115 [Chloroflexi bacterium]|nr:hypothetical protein [Chloroflexota bacterium]HBY08245.1 hypothetical protein [Chloroflexota bacterium]
MKNFFVRNSLYLLTALAAAVAFFLIWNWSALPVLQRMVGLLFIALTLHEWEEFRLPGGFAEMITSNLNFSLIELDSAKLLVAAAVSVIAFVPLFFPQVVWLAMAPVLLGIFENVAHFGAIKLFKRERFYTPGMATAFFLMLPISVYSLVYVVQNNLMQPIQWLFSFLFMAIVFVAGQATVITLNGMNYFNFIKTARTAILAKHAK